MAFSSCYDGFSSTIRAMSNGPGLSRPWNTRHFALAGAVLGVAVGIIHAYVHAFWSPLEGDVIPHVQFRMILFPMSGAALLASIAAIRNWLRQRP